MDLYLISLVTGAAGLLAMAVSGLSHSAGHTGHAGHAGHDVHGGHAGHSGDAGHVANGAHTTHAGDHGGSWVQNFLSPRVVFAILVGFGAGGLVAAPLGEPWQAGAGILTAAAFETLLVGPLWRFFFRFESNPAITLDSAIEDPARAVTGFDARGQGLVALDVDGQVVQLLASLSAEDRARGVRVHSGDALTVTSVDTARNRCEVRLPDR